MTTMRVTPGRPAVAGGIGDPDEAAMSADQGACKVFDRLIV